MSPTIIFLGQQVYYKGKILKNQLNNQTMNEQSKNCENSARAEREVADSQSTDNKIRETTIQELSHGYVVTVGCQRFAISKKEDLIQKLVAYINDPNKTQQEWFNGKLF